MKKKEEIKKEEGNLEKDEPLYSDEEEKEIRKRLRDLGYI